MKTLTSMNTTTKTRLATLSTSVALAAAALALTGCDLWFGNNHCDPSVAEPGLEIGLLDPFTGQCQYSGGGGGGTCGDFGGPIAADQAPEFVDMAACYSECTGLDEGSCLATPGCRAAYVGDCAEGLDCGNTTYTYADCWATAPSGPVQGECAGLDAYECSRHDDCVANHYPGAGCAGGACDPAPFQPGNIGNFEYCGAEPVIQTGCYSDEDCEAGFSCNAAEVCDPPPGCDPNMPCPTVCYGQCVPTPPAGSCYGDVFCDSLPPSCPAGTVPGIGDGCYTGACIEYAACDPALDPGTCDGELLCDSLPPECPPDSVPGILDGCYSGLCIPAAQCDPAVPPAP